MRTKARLCAAVAPAIRPCFGQCLPTHPLRTHAHVHTYTCRFHFPAAIFDEAHKLKGRASSTRAAAMRLDIGWKLLLTGVY